MFAGFMINTWAVATIVAPVAGVVGFFVVLRGSAFPAHAIPTGAFLQAGLFAAFDIQILWNQPMNQATFHAAITDTTPGIITDLLTRTAGYPASAVTGPGLSYTPLPAATPRQDLRVPYVQNVQKPTPIMEVSRHLQLAGAP